MLLCNAAIFTTLNAQTGGNNVIIWLIGAVVYGIFAIVMLRWGLLAMAVGALVSGMLQNIQTTFNSSAWYFPNTLFLFAVVAFLGVWGFRVSVAGRRLWNQDLFE